MSTFQILMFAATLFFAYQIYRHVQTLDESSESTSKTTVPDETPLPSDPQRWIDEADEAFQRNEFMNARTKLEEASRMAPDNPEILNKLAFVMAKTGERLDAIELYERSLNLDENDDLTHNAIASLYRQEKAYERAQDHYLKALEIDDAYAPTFYNYGNLLADMGEFDQARTMYKRALEIQSDFHEAREALLGLEMKA